MSPSLFASWGIPLTGKIRNVRALLASLGNTIRMYYQPTSSNKEMIYECFCFHQNESPTNQWQWTEKNGNAKGVFHPIRMYYQPSITNNIKELIIDSNCFVVKFLTVGIDQNHYIWFWWNLLNNFVGISKCWKLITLLKCVGRKIWPTSYSQELQYLWILCRKK